MYAYFKRLDYFSTECVYAPNAYRGFAREFLKDLEAVRPRAILDILHAGETLRVASAGTSAAVQGAGPAHRAASAAPPQQRNAVGPVSPLRPPRRRHVRALRLHEQQTPVQGLRAPRRPRARRSEAGLAQVRPQLCGQRLASLRARHGGLRVLWRRRVVHRHRRKPRPRCRGRLLCAGREGGRLPRVRLRGPAEGERPRCDAARCSAPKKARHTGGGDWQRQRRRRGRCRGCGTWSRRGGGGRGGFRRQRSPRSAFPSTRLQRPRHPQPAAGRGSGDGLVGGRGRHSARDTSWGGRVKRPGLKRCRNMDQQFPGATLGLRVAGRRSGARLPSPPTPHVVDPSPSPARTLCPVPYSVRGARLALLASPCSVPSMLSSSASWSDSAAGASSPSACPPLLSCSASSRVRAICSRVRMRRRQR